MDFSEAENARAYQNELIVRAAKVLQLCSRTENMDKFRKMIQRPFCPEACNLPEDYSVVPKHIRDMKKPHPADYTIRRAHILSILDPPQRREVSDQDLLVASYNFLTILHDKSYEYETHVTSISDDNWRKRNAGWIDPIWEQIEDAHNGNKASTIIGILDTMLDRVEKDLPVLLLADRKEGQGENAKEDLPEARHSIDFRSVYWFGTDYTFTPNQAAAVKLLWEAWENGTPDVGGDTIATNIESVSIRARDVFRGNPAYGSMIHEGATKGTFRLAEPEK